MIILRRLEEGFTMMIIDGKAVRAGSRGQKPFAVGEGTEAP